MSDTDKVLEISKRLEYLLETNYGAQGKGLHEKVTSVQTHLSPQLIKDIRKIATIRNKVVHEYNYNFSKDRGVFFQVGNKTIAQLEKANATYSQPVQNSNLYENHNNYTFSWKQKLVLTWQWVVANAIGAVFGVIATLIITGIASLIIRKDFLHVAANTSEFNVVLLSFLMLLTPFFVIHIAQQMFLNSAYNKVPWWWFFSTIGFVVNFMLIINFAWLTSNSWVKPINTEEPIFAVLISMASLPLATVQALIFKHQGKKAQFWLIATLVDWTIFIQSYIACMHNKDVSYEQLLILIASLIVGKIITGFALPNTGKNTYIFKNSVKIVSAILK